MHPFVLIQPLRIRHFIHDIRAGSAGCHEPTCQIPSILWSPKA